MKDKVICPDCGFVHNAVEFLERLELYNEKDLDLICASCYETIHVTWENIGYQSYEIDLQTGYKRNKDFTVRTYNKHDVNKLAVEFKGYNWSRAKEFAEEPSESEFKEAVKELKSELVEVAERYYSYNLKSIQKIKEGLK